MKTTWKPVEDIIPELRTMLDQLKHWEEDKSWGYIREYQLGLLVSAEMILNALLKDLDVK